MTFTIIFKNNNYIPFQLEDDSFKHNRMKYDEKTNKFTLSCEDNNNEEGVLISLVGGSLFGFFTRLDERHIPIPNIGDIDVIAPSGKRTDGRVLQERFKELDKQRTAIDDLLRFPH